MSNDATSSAPNKLDKWVVDIEGQLENCNDSSDSEEQPSIIGKWQCWDDFGASFIPQTKKWQFVAWMTHSCGLNVRSYLEYMQQKVDRAWSYYSGVDEQFRAENNERFIEHLLVNSCFLIFALVLLSHNENHLIDIMNEMNDQNGPPKGLTLKGVENITRFTNEDGRRTKGYMLTMNYQIPWFVIEAVYTELSNLSKLFVTPIHKIALSCFRNLRPYMHPSKEDGGALPAGEFKHLVHIFHWSRTLDGNYIPHRSKLFIGKFHIPSATELQLSQTVFEKVEGDSIDMSYSYNRRLSRVLQLTPWNLAHYSTKRYESLLRFERCYAIICGVPFTAYVACMSCLLKTEADVRVLRANGIIPDTSFDDKDVLRCVQELRTLIAGNLRMPDEIINLEEQVMAHHKKVSIE